MDSESETVIVDGDLQEVVATGNWCENCQYLEDPDDVSGGRCMSCGCDEASHVSVRVVTV